MQVDSRAVRSVAVTVVLACAFSASAPARARDPFDECVSAYEQAQVDKNGGKLVEARAKLLSCAQPVCPATARKDCSRWLDEVDGALPTVVVAARDAEGRDALAVRVLVDGHLLADRLDGKALAVDPGVHTFRYELEGAPAVEEKVTMREGEKNRKLAVSFAGRDRSADARPIPPLVFVLGGVALVGLGSFAYFGIRAKEDEAALRDTHCAPKCPVGEVDDIFTKQVVADVSLGVGVLSLGAAAILFFTRPSVNPQTAGSVRLDVGPARGGALGRLDLVF